MTNNRLITDADTVLLEEQLKTLDPKIYQTFFAALQARDFISPISNVDYAGSRRYEYRRLIPNGGGESAMSFRAQAPKSNASLVYDSQQFFPLIDACEFDLLDIQKGIDSSILEAAARNNAQNQNKMLLYSNSALGTKGLFDAAGVTVTNSALASWSSADTAADDIIDAINEVGGVVGKDEASLQPNEVLISSADFRVAQKLRSSVDNSNALELVARAHPGVRIRPALGLETAGTSSGRRMVVYNSNVDMLGGLFTPMTVMPAMQKTPYLTEVHMHSFCGGIVIRYSAAMGYFDAS